MRQFFSFLAVSALTLAITSAWTQGAYAGEGAKTVIDLQLQNDRSTRIDFDDLNARLDPQFEITNNNVSVSGGYLYFGSNFCFEPEGFEPIKACGIRPDGSPQRDVQSFTNQNIEHRFKQYLQDVYGLPESEFASFDGYMILDMEHPLHPAELYKYLDQPELFAIIVREYKRRIDVASAVLPKANLGIYGTIVSRLNPPDGMWEDTIVALTRAADLGLYENTSFLPITIYTRFVREDFGSQAAWERAARVSAERGAATGMMVAALDGVSRHELKPYPLLSLLAFRRAGVRIAEPEYIQMKLDVLSDLGINHYCFWEESDRPGYITDMFYELYGDGVSGPPGTPLPGQPMLSKSEIQPNPQGQLTHSEVPAVHRPKTQLVLDVGGPEMPRDATSGILGKASHRSSNVTPVSSGGAATH